MQPAAWGLPAPRGHRFESQSAGCQHNAFADDAVEADRHPVEVRQGRDERAECIDEVFGCARISGRHTTRFATSLPAASSTAALRPVPPMSIASVVGRNGGTTAAATGPTAFFGVAGFAGPRRVAAPRQVSSPCWQCRWHSRSTGTRAGVVTIRLGRPCCLMPVVLSGHAITFPPAAPAAGELSGS